VTATPCFSATGWLIPFRLGILVVVYVLGFWNAALADPIAVHHREGISHGFLVLRSLDGKILASGDQFQVVDGNKITSEIVFHFKDGSVHDETTVFSQDQAFRLLSDHLVQKGPSFPKPIDIMIDASSNQVTIHADNKGREKDATQHLDLPEDIANGMVLTLLRNILPSVSETKVSMLAASSKPRLVKLSIVPRGERVFMVIDSKRKATDFDIKIQIGGVAGTVAPFIGKQPPDTHIWLSSGTSPTFIRSEGPLYEGGPVWRTDIAAVRVSDRDLNSRSNQAAKKK